MPCDRDEYAPAPGSQGISMDFNPTMRTLQRREVRGAPGPAAQALLSSAGAPRSRAGLLRPSARPSRSPHYLARINRNQRVTI